MNKEERNKWLADYNLTESDVLVDVESGEEFIMVMDESDHSDDYQIHWKKVFLPDLANKYII